MNGPTVAALVRRPVRAVPGEEITSSHVGPAGLLGDTTFAVVDADGVVVDAAEPGLSGLRATCSAEPRPDRPLPPVDVRFPDGSTLRSDDERVHVALSDLLGREVRLVADPEDSPATLRLLAGTAPERPVSDAGRPHVLVEGADGAGADWVGRTVTLGEEVEVRITGAAAGGGVHGDAVTAGTVRVGDPVTVA